MIAEENINNFDWVAKQLEKIWSKKKKIVADGSEVSSTERNIRQNKFASAASFVSLTMIVKM